MKNKLRTNKVLINKMPFKPATLKVWPPECHRESCHMARDLKDIIVQQVFQVYKQLLSEADT